MRERDEILDAVACLSAAAAGVWPVTCVNVAGLEGLAVFPSPGVPPAWCRVVPVAGAARDARLDGTPLGTPADVRHVFVHPAVCAQLERRRSA